eukprot:1156760-Pelagomonas_calceolata.AAC.1
MAIEVFEILFGSQTFNFFMECAMQVWDRAYSVQLEPLRVLTIPFSIATALLDFLPQRAASLLDLN